MKYRQKEGYVILIVFGIIDVLMILNTGITKEDIFSGRGWDIIAIEGLYIYFMIRFGIFNLRVIELEKKTCSVSLLGIKKVYKWEEITVICHDVVHSNYRKNFGRLSEGIFFQ